MQNPLLGILMLLVAGALSVGALYARIYLTGYWFIGSVIIANWLVSAIMANLVPPEKRTLARLHLTNAICTYLFLISSTLFYGHYLESEYDNPSLSINQREVFGSHLINDLSRNLIFVSGLFITLVSSVGLFIISKTYNLFRRKS